MIQLSVTLENVASRRNEIIIQIGFYAIRKTWLE